VISQVILITARLLVVAVEFQGHKLKILSPKVGGPLEVMTVVGVATFSRNSAEAGSSMILVPLEVLLSRSTLTNLKFWEAYQYLLHQAMS
jgi:hypothetical protein